MQPTAGAVIIGNEILSGKFSDENTPHLIAELRKKGIRLMQVALLDDIIDDIATTVADFSGRYDYVITSGGIGPTHDDVTFEAIAKATGSALALDEQLDDLVRSYWGPNPTDRQRTFAHVPSQTRLVPHEDLSWPLAVVDNIYVLPGVPKLFRKKLAVAMTEFRSVVIVQRKLFLDVRESLIADELARFASSNPDVQIGSYPRHDAPDHSLIITLEGVAKSAVESAATVLTKAFKSHVVRVEAD